MRFKTALALSTSCFLLTSCGDPKRVVEAIPIPADRMDCVYSAKRPVLPAEYQIDWKRVTTVAQAKAEHDKYVVSVRSREGIVSGYIVEVEGKYFLCSNDAEWLRDWQKGLTK
jgi:hypothetical protein